MGRSAAFSLIMANVAVFILQIFLGSWFTESFMLVAADAFSRPWILLTSMFLHANANHILFNMYALYIFGPLLEQRIGPKRFLAVYFASGILAAFASVFFYDAALGASGAIMGMLGVTIMLIPDLPVLFLFFIPMSLRTAGIVFALIDIFGIFVPNGVANIAHLVGLAVGLISGYFFLKQKKTFHHRFSHSKDVLSEEDVDDYLKYGRL